MPGAYAHITMAFNGVEERNFEDMGLDRGQVAGLLEHERWFELGAISPDMPYLHLLDGASGQWADDMHRAAVGARLRSGLGAVIDAGGLGNPKVLAWYLGFLGHVTFDVFMHPVVNLRVGGVYSEDTAALHRECEMHQDARAVHRFFGVQNVAHSRLTFTGLATLHRPGDDDSMDPEIKAVWETMLRESTPQAFAANPPDIDAWYNGFTNILGVIESTGGLVSFARHIGANVGYPSIDQVEASFVEHLETPAGDRRTYDALFDAGAARVLAQWGHAVRAVRDGNRSGLDHVGDWNLDTGGDNVAGNLVFWG